MKELNKTDIVLESLDNISYDRDTIPQEKLNLEDKYRSSLFPWRGQFSPEFIEVLLEYFTDKNDVILDPFVGSGTVLFESARRSLECYAAEINPSAVIMASTAYFMNVEPELRQKYIKRAISIAESILFLNDWNLFTYKTYDESKDNISFEKTFEILIDKAENNKFILNIFFNALIRCLNSNRHDRNKKLFKAIKEHTTIIKSLPYTPVTIGLFHTDARAIPLKSQSINKVITSPPYINVFNYHQNNRPAMELIGWDILRVAQSEFGSNRKHRQNRFLTVIQYCLDMLDALVEMRRLLVNNGRAIIIVGRESNIRSISFKNGRIVAGLAIGGAGFKLERIQERSFINRFGKTIFEDILHLIPVQYAQIQGDIYARNFAKRILIEAVERSKDSIKSEILDAVNKSDYVKKSPLFTSTSMDSGRSIAIDSKSVVNL